MSKKSNGKYQGAKLVSAAILGLDYRNVVVAGKRYVIHPPTIARLAGAASRLADVAEAETVAEVVASQKNIMSAAAALSQFIDGTDSHTEALSKGTLAEVAGALREAYSMVDVGNFTMLSAMSGALCQLTARPRP